MNKIQNGNKCWHSKKKVTKVVGATPREGLNFGYIQNKVLRSGTLSQTLDSANFATARRLLQLGLHVVDLADKGTRSV